MPLTAQVVGAGAAGLLAAGIGGLVVLFAYRRRRRYQALATALLMGSLASAAAAAASAASASAFSCGQNGALLSTDSASSERLAVVSAPPRATRATLTTPSEASIWAATLTMVAALPWRGPNLVKAAWPL